MSLTVKELKALLEDFVDDAIVVVELDDSNLLYPINPPVCVEGYGVVGANGHGGVATYYQAVQPDVDVKGSTFPIVIL